MPSRIDLGDVVNVQGWMFKSKDVFHGTLIDIYKDTVMVLMPDGIIVRGLSKDVLC